MNWLGLSLRSLLGIAVGLTAGLLVFLFLWPNVIAVGVCAGAGCAIFSADRSGMRGVSVATVATWAAAIVDARRFGVSVFQVSTTLTFARWLAYLACIIAALAIGGSTVRRTAKVRTAGT